MYKVAKEFHFSASHILEGLPEDHPCSRLHGHNYVIVVELSSIKLDRVGFVTDYRALEPIKKFIDSTFDHCHLNDKMSCNPTAENIAELIYTLFKDQFPNISAVKVRETPKTEAIYYDDSN
jgi:6-pyruvoyltetrahydropterin/6-carboxytetrahydropterin synthase